MKIAGFIRWIFLWVTMFVALPLPAHAVDSYRYLHVTIETPWMIFVFLFFLVFFPMILMAVLYWWYALKRSDKEGKEHEGS